MKYSSDFFKKELERNDIYYTAPKCPFCGGTMLPLNYLVDGHGYKAPYAWLYDEITGELKACNDCGIVKFYPDKE